ncbi:MAG: sugar phosphate nucleotidyltransferase [Pseudomonadota bacterium]
MKVDIAILAGGSGTRLWPLSDGHQPKQFLALPAGKSLLEQAVSRARKIAEPDHIWIITLASQLEMTEKLLPSFSPERILAEPVGRNSGPAALAAALHIEAVRGAPTTILVMPADHYVPDETAFAVTMKKGIARAATGASLVTFGLEVRAPRTDFGYIETRPHGKNAQVFQVKRFIEKPSQARAKAFAKSKRFFWNSGIFAWRSDRFVREMALHAPDIVRALKGLAWKEIRSEDDLKETYSKLPNISIDYALMEKSKNVEVIPARFAWSDVGTWDAVFSAVGKKAAGNVKIGKCLVAEGKGNLALVSAGELVLFGVDNLVVIRTPDVTLVTTRAKSRDLKRFLEKYRP